MKTKTGVFIIGALGQLATMVIVGASALKRRLFPATGMVTERGDFSGVDLVDVGDLVFGGWEIRRASLLENAYHILGDIRSLSQKELSDLEEELKLTAANIVSGTTANCGSAIQALKNLEENCNNSSLKEIILRLKDDLRRFRSEHNLDTVVVVNLSSTEPPCPKSDGLIDREKLDKIIELNDAEAIRASTIYSYAAIDSGCAYINFTPSDGAMVPGLIDMAVDRGVPVMGSDGKTGETLVKSALAPMFAMRNLKVLSWEGYNMLGNMDGKILSHPENKLAKIKTKDEVLHQILGYSPHSNVSIDYVPSLGDWKTAWDFIHFEGFLNTKMSLQFTWQGCDSALAAPLVLDLVRLSVFALQKGEKGLMKHLACFFKSPLDVEEHNLNEQYKMLKDYVAKHYAQQA